MLLDFKFAPLQLACLSLGIFSLSIASCGDSESFSGNEVCSSQELAEIAMGLGNIVRDGFDELEQEANLASTNVGGVADSTRFVAYFERHQLRIGALAQLEQKLKEISPTSSEASLHTDELNLVEMLKRVYEENFALTIVYLQKGLDLVDRERANPFVQMGQKQMEIYELLKRVEGRTQRLTK